MAPAAAPPAASSATAAVMPALPESGGTAALVTCLGCSPPQDLSHVLAARFLGLRGDAVVVGRVVLQALLLEFLLF